MQWFLNWGAHLLWGARDDPRTIKRSDIRTEDAWSDVKWISH